MLAWDLVSPLSPHVAIREQAVVNRHSFVDMTLAPRHHYPITQTLGSVTTERELDYFWERPPRDIIQRDLTQPIGSPPKRLQHAV